MNTIDHMAGAGHQAFLHDPSGNFIELNQPRPGAAGGGGWEGKRYLVGHRCGRGFSPRGPNPRGPSHEPVSAPTGPTTSAVSPFANLYAQILGPADAATGAFFTALEALPKTATGADALKPASRAANAIDAADRGLRGVSWPANVSGDIHALVTANARLVADLRGVGTQPRMSSGPWRTRFEGDVRQISQYVSALRTDLNTPGRTG